MLLNSVFGLIFKIFLEQQPIWQRSLESICKFKKIYYYDLQREPRTHLSTKIYVSEWQVQSSVL